VPKLSKRVFAWLVKPEKEYNVTLTLVYEFWPLAKTLSVPYDATTHVRNGRLLETDLA